MTERSVAGSTLAMEMCEGRPLKPADVGTDRAGVRREGSVMSLVCCSRCRKSERIPTHQFVKFDLNVQYLCDGCWKNFRSWFFASERIKREQAPQQFAETEMPESDRRGPSSHVA